MFGYTVRPEWMTVQVWRSYRTFVQGFMATLLMNAGDVLATGSVDWGNILTLVVIPALSAGFAAASNAPNSTEDTAG